MPSQEKGIRTQMGTEREDYVRTQGESSLCKPRRNQPWPHLKLLASRTGRKEISDRSPTEWVWLCDSTDWGPSGFSIHGIFLARILECVTISSFRGSSQPGDRTSISCISCLVGSLFTTEQLRKPIGLLIHGILLWQSQQTNTYLSQSYKRKEPED